MLNIILSILLPQCPYSFSHLNNTGHFSILRCTYLIHVFLQLGQSPCGFWEPCSFLGDEWPHSVSLCLLGSNRGHWAASITSWENRGSCDTFAFNEGQNSHPSNFRQKPIVMFHSSSILYLYDTHYDWYQLWNILFIQKRNTYPFSFFSPSSNAREFILTSCSNGELYVTECTDG